MCTVTWLRSRPGEYALCFNRDERRARAPARPPRQQVRGGIRFIAPEDPEGGGTWLAVNEQGLAVGVLNFYEVDHVWRAHQPVSRGHLVLAMADAPDVGEVTRRMRHLRAEDYHPFLLLALDPGGTTRLHRWDGRHVDVRDLGEDDLPLTTSSFDTRTVLAHRSALFRRVRETAHGLTLEALERYHDSRDSRGGAYSVLMTRDDAQTVSFSRITVDPRRIEFHYVPVDHAHVAGPATVVHLDRA